MDAITFLFCSTFLTLIFLIFYCLNAAAVKMKNSYAADLKKYNDKNLLEQQGQERELTEEDYEILADMKATRLSIVATLTECCELNAKAILKEKHPEQVEDQWLSKFDASKAKRKQSPSSSATPVVKSRRGSR